MLFNSYTFLIHFLPVVLGIFLLLFYINKKTWALIWLTLASLYFYAHWNVNNLPIFILSIIANFYFGKLIVTKNKTILYLGIAFNLTLLGFFKYTSFIAEQINIENIPEIALPLAISFFTFQQIAYLVDIHRQIIKPFPFRQYILFVSFFPHLIAGPIMHYREMMPQFINLKITKEHWNKVALGITIFSIGLFKKVALADQFATISDPAFAAANTGNLTTLDAWQGMLAYSFQIYFDFSGYAEMAIGLGLLFGIYLPINFNSPYKAINIVDFWRRWHITLSTFLRNYLYIPLGGNRFGKIRHINSLVITMLLAGLWHGAGWNFIIWGGLHGILLAITHYYLKNPTSVIGKIISILTTFFLVTLLWILFRAESLSAALNYYQSLFTAFNIDDIFNHKYLYNTLLLIAGFLIIWILPNTIQLLQYQEYAAEKKLTLNLNLPLKWYGLIAGLLLFFSIKTMLTGTAQNFIYFVF